MDDENEASPIPSSFRYRNVYEKGKPVHDKFDSFYVKHPPMELSRRDKIFSPFDALKGFNDAIFDAELRHSSMNEPAPSDSFEDDDSLFMNDDP